MPPYDGKLKKSVKIKISARIQRSLPDLTAKKIGPYNKKAIPFISNRDERNALEGFKKRLATDTPPFDDSLTEEVKFTVRQLLRKLQPLPYMEWDDSYIESFLQHYDKPLREKDNLRKAYHEAVTNGLRRSHYKIKCFVKREFYEEDKYSRIIMTRTPELKALLSNAIHKCDEELFHNSELSRYFIKGLTPQQQVDAMEHRFNGHAMFLETDYSSFESSFTPTYQKLVELKFFKHMLKNNPHILKIVKRCYQNHLISSKSFSATILGCRMSGDLWTSSMNGFSNLVNIITLARIKGVSFDGYCEGDDGLFWVSNQGITSDDYARLGFTIKMQYKANVSDCSFCGKIFDPKTKHVLATPEQLNRVGWSHNKRYWNAPAHVKQSLIESRALAIAYTYPGCPCLQAWAKSILTHRKTHHFSYAEIREKYQLKEILRENPDLTPDSIFNKLTFPEPHINDRILYEHRFGISVSAQHAFENFVLKHPWADFSLLNSDLHTGGRTNWSRIIRYKDTARHVW